MSTGRQAGKGCFDCVVVCFAHDNLAQDDGARHGTGDGYRFLGEFRAGATMGLLTGTIAPFDGSAAALALVSTSSWMYCTNSWIWRCISSMRSRICRMIAIPLMFTPRSRASERMNSSRCKSSSVYRRVLPSVREGLSRPSRSYRRRVWGWIPFISATAEIMYAPLDFRLVSGPELYDHQFTTKQSGHGSLWIRPIKKQSVFMPANSWSRVSHFGGAKWPST